MNYQNADFKMPSKLQVVLHILSADEELKRKALPFIDTQWCLIHWDRIFRQKWKCGHYGALLFAKALWCDRVTTKSDPFNDAFAMDRKLQRACVEALSLHWGLVSGLE